MSALMIDGMEGRFGGSMRTTQRAFAVAILAVGISGSVQAQDDSGEHLYLECDGYAALPTSSETDSGPMKHLFWITGNTMYRVDEYGLMKELICLGPSRATEEDRGTIPICDFGEYFFLGNGEYENEIGEHLRSDLRINRLSARMEYTITNVSSGKLEYEFTGTCEPFTPLPKKRQF